MGLGALRHALGLTQVELAKRLDVTQGNVAQIEKRGDLLVSTLASYMHAVGGDVRIVVQFPGGHAIEVELDALDRTDGRACTRTVVSALAGCIATSNAISNGIAGTGWDSLVLNGTTTTETQDGMGSLGTRRHQKDGGSVAHNPKVVGSNPTPATICAGQSRSRAGSLVPAQAMPQTANPSRRF